MSSSRSTPRSASGKDGRPSCVTPIQAATYASYMRTHSESETARELGLSQIRVRECLVQYERNLLRDAGVRPPPLKEMLRGDISTRFQIARNLRNGRPAKHERAVSIPIPAAPAATAGAVPAATRRIDQPASGVRRLVVTAADPARDPHAGFMRNLAAYADHHGAELVVLPFGPDRPAQAGRSAGPVDVAGRIHVRSDVRPPAVSRSPLEGLQHLSPCAWAAIPHPTLQLESLPRLRSAPPRVQMTTGAATVHADASRGAAARLGALVIELTAEGATFVRHVSTSADGDGGFNDLDERVSAGRVATRRRVAGLVLGDLHQPLTDGVVAAATWGPDGLVERLRPRTQVVHDACDFRARSPHQRRDHHARFAHHVRGTDDVRAEMRAVADALAAMRRPGGEVAVVRSNHDDFLIRWLREADHRTDHVNAEFLLDRERALHAMVRAGVSPDTLFAETLRSLSDDGLAGVRFLADGESLQVGGVECGIHGHAGPDGSRGSVVAFDRLGMDMVVGHFHQPAIRGGVHVAGTCQLDLGYGRGPTSWAVAHVVVHDDGARQHVFLDRGRFAA